MYKNQKEKKNFEKQKQKKRKEKKTNWQKQPQQKNVTCNLECVIVTRINQPYLWL